MNKSDFDQPRRGSGTRYGVALLVGGAVLAASGAAAWPVLKSVVSSDVASAVTAPAEAPGADEAQLMRVSAFVAETELSSDVAAISTMQVPSGLASVDRLDNGQTRFGSEVTFVPEAPARQTDGDSPEAEPIVPRTARESGGSEDRASEPFTPRSLASAPARQSVVIPREEQQISLRDPEPFKRNWSVGQFR
ncbi:MAG: hypothetical protein JJU42_02940 [Rhodobacteraceae bacterium]|nr:hypothetical protein [Paracoccaceae bacterium]